MRAVIVIFGCAVLRDGSPSPTLRNRIETAAAFGRTLADPLFVATGGVGRYGPSEASVMAQVLRELGVAGERIVREETATDTLSSARALARLLRGHDGAVYAATSGFHQLRCVMLLRLAGLDARFSPSPPASPNPAMRWYWRLREVPAIPYDLLLMLALRLVHRV